MNETDVAVKLAEHEQKISTLFRRVEKIEALTESINNLTTAVKVQSERFEQLNTQMHDIAKNVDEIRNEPVDTYKHIKRTIITGVITAVVGAIMGALIAGIFP